MPEAENNRESNYNVVIPHDAFVRLRGCFVNNGHIYANNSFSAVLTFSKVNWDKTLFL